MKQNRSNLVLGIILLAIGGWLLATRQIPDLQAWMENNFTWPMWTIGAGALILLIGLLTNAPGMAVPAAIVAGIGGILYYQDHTGNYASWSYMWTLIPGFVGVGSIIAGRIHAILGQMSTDQFHPAIIRSAQLNLGIATTTRTCRNDQRAHSLAATSTIALGRLLTAAALTALVRDRSATLSLQRARPCRAPDRSPR